MNASLLLLLLAGCPHNVDSPELVYQLDREVIALKQRIAQLEASACAEDAGPQPIYQELIQVLSGSEASVSRDGAETRVTLPAASAFAGSSLRLRDEATMALDMVATALNLHPDQAVVVVGHGDDTPPSSRSCHASPWELAAARAGAVARALVDDFGVDPSRVTVASRGATEPVADNDTPEGRAANRRVVIRILPPDPPTPPRDVP